MQSRYMSNRRLYAMLFLASALAAVAVSPTTILPVFHDRLVDGDSYMRLLRIEQGLKHGYLANVVQRDDSGAPMVVEWSRLVDAFIVALAAPLAFFVGWHHALYIAGVATQPIFAGALGASLSFASEPLSKREFLWVAPVVGILLPGVRGFDVFGVIHYHIILLAAIAFTLGWCFRARNGALRPMFYCGIAGGLAIWITPETMPFVLLGYVALGLSWLQRPIGAGMALLGASFFLTTAFGTLIDPPHGGIWVAESDRISIIYAELALAVAAACLALAWLDKKPMSGVRRKAFGLVAALLSFAIWLACWPRISLGPFGLIPHSDMRVFYGQMAEVQPVTGATEFFLLLFPGLFAMVYVLLRAWRSRRDVEASGAWLVLAAGIALSTGLTARFVIFQQIPAGFAAALAPVILTDITDSVVREAAAASLRVSTFFFLLVFPYLPALTMAYLHPQKSVPHGGSCSTVGIGRLLAPASGKIVLTAVNYAPQLLYRTKIIIVGSLYQHGIKGYLRARAAWRAPATPSPSPQLRATGAEFVLFCNTTAREYLGPHTAKNSLWALLVEHRPPHWLHLVGEEPKQGFRLYRVAGSSDEHP